MAHPDPEKEEPAAAMEDNASQDQPAATEHAPKAPTAAGGSDQGAIEIQVQEKGMQEEDRMSCVSGAPSSVNIANVPASKGDEIPATSSDKGERAYSPWWHTALGHIQLLVCL